MTAPDFTGLEFAGEDCAGCDTPMVITYDALRRPRKRCPKCDGVSRKAPRHPDTVLRPVVLGTLVLPPIEEGQLRCQRCAYGVEGTARFCTDCQRHRRRAGQLSTATPRWHHPQTLTCLSCGSQRPRFGGRATSKSCPSCKPRGARNARIYQPKPCAEPGCRKMFTPTGPRAAYCEACR